ncbi:MAG: tetratricopeptide repeat protein [Betaproteobacteria bacterium]
MYLISILVAAVALLSSPAFADAEAARQALAALRDSNFDGVRQACQAQADAGDAPCQEAIGRLLLDAKYPSRDPKKGIALLRQAADAGLVNAQASLGFEHLMGLNAEPNAELAISYMTKAAEAGSAVARSNLGNLYRDGRLVARDLVRARGLYASSTAEFARLGYAEMAFFGEGGPREVELAVSMFTESAKSSNPATARRAQSSLDTAKRLANAEKYDLALYFNPYSSDVRRNLEGKLLLRDTAGKGPHEICWPDALARTHVAEANVLTPGYEQRALARFRKVLADAGIATAPANLVRDAGCLRRAPFMVATRSLSAQLAAPLMLPLAGDSREAHQIVKVDLIDLVVQTNLEARDRSAQIYNDGFVDRASKWALAESAASGKPVFAALQIGTSSGSVGVCALKTDAQAARVLAQQSEYWSARRPAVAPNASSLRDFDSAEALFDAITARADACPVVIAPADAVNRLSTALTRDKITHRVFVNAAWTPTEIAEIDARSQGFASSQQMEFANSLKATPEGIKRLTEAGIARSDDLAAIRKRASTLAYPSDLGSVEAILNFLDDEAAGKKVKKTATQMARERSAAEEVARKKKEAADQLAQRNEEAARKKKEAAEQLALRNEEAARKKAEAAEAEQKKRDEKDSNAERLSEIAGVAGAMMCRSAADSYVASVAKYAHKWDDVGFLGVLFDKYLVKVETPGVLTMTSSHLAMQNGFGAFKKVRVFCDYNTRTKKVLDVRILDQ